MKRLVICCDGTWQKLDNPYPTNILKMAQAIRLVDDQGIAQVVYYDDGVGATGDVFDKVGGGAFGWGIDNKIQQAYRFLSLNYTPGDQVYLFGYSRGAYTVRSLGGMIYCSGLLKRQFVSRTSEAYELYRSRDRSKGPSGSEATAFRKAFGDRLDITVLGCWDTVGSLGVPDIFPYISDLLNRRYRFFDTEVNRRIGRAFHAVAVDEIRSVFDVTPMQHSHHREPEQVKQVWFPGDHECVGGGEEKSRGLSDITLSWMMDQVEPMGLALDRNAMGDGLKLEPLTPFDNKPRGVFRLTGKHLRRVAAQFSDLHPSVKRRWKDVEEYAPANLQPFEQDLDGWGGE